MLKINKLASNANIVNKSGKCEDIIVNLQETCCGNSVYKLAFVPEWTDFTGEFAINIDFTIPIDEISGFWTPLRSGGFENQNFIKWEHSFTASLEYNYPVIAFVDRELGHQGLISFLGFDATSHFSIKLSQVDECFKVEFRYPDIGFINRSDWSEISFYISEPLGKDFKVFNAIDKFMNYFNSDIASMVPKRDIPDSAYGPAYCTWYAVHGSPTAEWAEKTASLAAQLGFENFIMDDGWFYEKFQRIDIKVESWFENIGDWIPAGNKFPDFSEHVKKVKNLGLKYILWFDPYAVGKGSEAYIKAKDYLGEFGENGSAYYCVQDKRAHETVVSTAVRLVKDYGIDGFKVDYLYGISPDDCQNDKHCHFENTNGKALAKTMKEMYKQVKSICPEFNMVHVGSPLMNSFSTSLRAIDVPFDADTNLYFLIYIKLFAYKLPVQSDPLYWPKNASLQDISRHLMVSVFSVPSVSVDLLNLPEQQLSLIKNWLSFYNNNRETLAFGQFSVGNVGPIISYVSSESEKLVITGVFREALVSVKEDKRNILLNGSSADTLIVESSVEGSVQMFDMFFSSYGEKQILSKGINILKVPVGGYVSIDTMADHNDF